MYQMTTLANGTRIRKNHTTFADVLTSVTAGVDVTGTELWTAPADGAEVRQGDQWLYVNYGGITGWMAYKHKGVPICKELHEITDPPAPTFPVYARVKHFQERYGVSYLEHTHAPKKCNGLPEVFQYTQTATQKPVKMNRKIQEWMFSLFEESAKGNGQNHDAIVKGWTSTFAGGRAFTNKAGFPAYNNYIKYPKTDDDDNDPKLGYIMSCGATIKVLREVKKSGGVVLVEFEVINISKLNTSWKWSDIPHLVYAAVNNIRDTDGGKYPHGQDVPFPGLAGHDVPIPLLSTIDTGLLDKGWVEYLPAGTKLPAYPYYR